MCLVKERVSAKYVTKATSCVDVLLPERERKGLARALWNGKPLCQNKTSRWNTDCELVARGGWNSVELKSRTFVGTTNKKGHDVPALFSSW